MKRIFIFMTALISTASCASPIMDDSTVVTLKTKNGSIFHVKSCEEFNALIDKGEKIADYPDVPDRFVSDIRDALTQCRIDELAKKENLEEIKNKSDNNTIQEVISHFPASEAIAVSDESVESLKKNHKGQTILQMEKDLKVNSQHRAISESNKEGYMITNQRNFKDKNGEVVRFITLGKFLTEGTWSTSDTYKVTSVKDKIWQVHEINPDDKI